jgi:hypothetical protein
VFYYLELEQRNLVWSSTIHAPMTVVPPSTFVLCLLVVLWTKGATSFTPYLLSQQQTHQKPAAAAGRGRSGLGGRQRQKQTSCAATAPRIDTSFMWNSGLSFGKGQFKFYDGFDKWMSVFPDQDRNDNPELFNLPPGTYEVQLAKPLGIVFEEIDMGRGLYVKELVAGGNADQLLGGSIIQPGDLLIGITAVKIVGAKYERRLIPSRKFDFDTMIGAIESNSNRYGCTNVILAFERPGVADSAQVDTFMQFFEPPFDNPWKQRQ